jgi:hypothetical protein
MDETEPPEEPTEELHIRNGHVWDILDPRNTAWTVVRACFDMLKDNAVLTDRDIGEFLYFLQCWQDRIDRLVAKIRAATDRVPQAAQALTTEMISSYIDVLELFDLASIEINKDLLSDETMLSNIKSRIKSIIRRMLLTDEEKRDLYSMEIRALSSGSSGLFESALTSLRENEEISGDEYSAVLSVFPKS